MQKRLAIILCTLMSSAAASAQPVPYQLKKADSLYQNRQYTQAFELYQDLFKQGRYSSSMFLKMAHIQEGLHHLGESLYYLNLYFLASDDTQALRKMEELAEKNNLQGYETSETTRALAWLQEHYASIALLLTASCVLLLSLSFYLTFRKKTRPVFTFSLLLLLMVVLFVHVNYSRKSEFGIVAGTRTYLMSGPSSASSVVAIVGEGHQLEIKGKKDVWLKVTWRNRDVYVKEFLVRPVSL